MPQIYRFRSRKQLLDRGELDGQYIYFAAGHELNDPTEGLVDIVWRGDRVVWTNFFVHYLICLQFFCSTIRQTANARKLLDLDVLMDRVLNAYWEQHHDTLDDFSTTVFQQARIADIISFLDGRTVRRDGVLCLLERIHRCSLGALEDLRDGCGIPGQGAGALTVEFDLPEPSIKDENLEYFFKAAFQRIDDWKLNMRFRGPKPTNNFEHNRNLLVYDFPKFYLERIRALLYPRWYTACFARDFHNSSMWSHYGDAHRGVCLIFETKPINKKEYLVLSQDTEEKHSKPDREGESLAANFRVRKIDYGRTPREVDFFQSLGALTWTEVFRLWYKDSGGNISESSTVLDEESWSAHSQQMLYESLTKKSIDWEYEKECRLILTGSRTDWMRDSRRYRYGFESLSGVIFGIRTPDDDKLRILEVLQEKCKNSGRCDLNVYQAYYDNSRSSIQRRELSSVQGFAGFRYKEVKSSTDQ